MYTAFYFGKRRVIDSLLNWLYLLCFCKNSTKILVACQAYVVITSKFVLTSTDLSVYGIWFRAPPVDNCAPLLFCTTGRTHWCGSQRGVQHIVVVPAKTNGSTVSSLA